MNKENIIKKLFDLVEPIVKEKDCELYYIEYVKESGENYLRIYIDSPNGITFNDCEKVSRAVSDMLDVNDPISEAYYLEVSSPGIERTLFTDEHLRRYIESTVLVKLSKLFEGKKKFEGNLIDFNSDNIVINFDNKDMTIPREKISTISLKGEF